MATYSLGPTRANLHGHFSPDLAPALTIEPGDTVVFETLEAGWRLLPRALDAPRGDARDRFAPYDPALDDGHALVGPLFVRGAMPGMTLKVTIGEVVPADWGWTRSGGWPHPVNERFGLTHHAGTLLKWTIDSANGTATDQHGHTVNIRPFLGVMGMPPSEPGIHSTAPPRATGGNLDCKELVAGSELYLPIAVEGGLFSCGDGHARQGDGEVSVTAIECPMQRAALTFDLVDESLSAPRARTSEGWLTFGLHEDLEEAMYRALEQMVDLIAERYQVDRAEALALASVAADLRITQIVNGVRGVHAILPHDAITKSV